MFCLEVGPDEEAKDAEGKCCWTSAQEFGVTRELLSEALGETVPRDCTRSYTGEGWKAELGSTGRLGRL